MLTSSLDLGGLETERHERVGRLARLGVEITGLHWAGCHAVLSVSEYMSLMGDF